MNQLRHNKKDLKTPGCAYCKDSNYLSVIDLYVPNPNSENCKKCRNYDLEPKSIDGITEAEMTALKQFEATRVLSE